MMSNYVFLEKTRKSLEKYFLQKKPGSLVLLGNEHMGKYHVGREVAAKLLLLDDVEQLPLCNDYFEITPENGNIKVQQMRAMIEQSRYEALGEAEKKVFLIDDADRMTDSAQNALLKLAEDGNEKNIIIFIAHKPLLETIHSRCYVVKFYPLSEKELPVSIIPEDMDKEMVLYLAAGRYGAVSYFTQQREFITYCMDFNKKLMNMRERRELLEITGFAKEKDKSCFMDLFDMEYVSYFYLVLLRAFHMSFLFPFCPPEECSSENTLLCQALLKLFGEDGVMNAACIISNHINMIRKKIYNRNDAFEMLTDIITFHET